MFDNIFKREAFAFALFLLLANVNFAIAKTIEVEVDGDESATPTLTSETVSFTPTVALPVGRATGADSISAATSTVTPRFSLSSPTGTATIASSVPAATNTATPELSEPSATNTPTQELSDDSANTEETPTPTPILEPSPTDTETVVPKKEPVQAPARTVPSLKLKRVRAAQDISFYSFLSSGFVVMDSEPREILGLVYAFEGDPMSYSQPSEAHVKLDHPTRSKVGDLLTIYHLYKKSLDNSELGFQGSWAEIQAVVQIQEIIKDMARVKIIEGFQPFSNGDMARDYGIDVKRWKKAQTKKNLPLADISCSVAGGYPLNVQYKQTDTIVLTAGSDKGLVEGMVFELDRKTDRGLEGNPLFNPLGFAEVFFCGNQYSLARVTESRDGIQKGFAAFYRP